MPDHWMCGRKSLSDVLIYIIAGFYSPVAQQKCIARFEFQKQSDTRCTERT
jgi:hypothetical protein